MSLTKPFSEVFPTLQLSGEEGELFRTSEVRRVSATKDRSRVEVYLVSTNIITDRQIKSMEKKLSSLFIGRRTKVILHTRFNLSEQYNTKTLLEMYKDSMAGELKSISPLTYNVYRKADIYPSDEKTLVVNLTDNIVSHKEAENIRSFLDHVFNVRCSVTTHIKIKYEKAEPTPERREAEKNILDFLNSVTHKDPEKTAEEKAAQKALEEEKRKEEDRRRKGFRNAKNPDVIYGRDFKDDCRSIDTIIGDLEESVTVKGKLICIDEHAISNETQYIIKLDMTDFTDSISIKVFINAEDHDEFRSLIGADGLEKGKPGIFVKVKGVYMTDKFDRENTIQKIYGIKTIPAFGEVREDNAPVKRVELHCHTKMSEMDAVSDVGSILKQASSWGMKALAVTDHGNVQVFPVANHSLPADPEFKMIYGVEGYLVDDTQKVVTQIGLNETKEKHSLKGAYVVFDIETTGLSPEKNRIIEIGAVRVENGEVVGRYNEFVNPEVPIPFRIQNLTGINDKMVMGAPTIKDILPGFLEFSKDAVMVAHNASFDCSFIRKNAKDLGLDFSKTVVDTVALSRLLLPGIKNYKLDTVAHELSVSLENHHRAVDDATCTGEIFIKLCNKLMEQDIYTLEGIEKIDVTTSSVIKKMRMHHVVILAKNETGRINLYKLVSLSHINYFSKRPRIPKSMLTRYREGLIIGSACASGELFNEILRGASEEELVRTASFYDYLEIQPLGNNRFLMNDDENDYTEEDLKAFNVKILKLGEALGKPVCATGDVHFLNPSDAIYRRIIMNGKGYDDADEQPPLYLHTTDEMLREFSYLGEEKAYEVVVKNTNMIADMIDRISPVRPDKCPPVIENSDQILRQICFDKAKEIYGEKLPVQVEERLEKELKSIISNGYAVMYVIAQKLVWKSNEDGYLVGSRGSVGSSFVAFMSGITEVNSLPPHYICPVCHYYDFDSPEVREFSKKGMCGSDMPDRVCPDCGAPLSKEGFDIPFETFLGFKGDKEPDIDLNFSGDYQSKAHKYTEVIFGAGQTFRAGTIGTLAEKTALGYVNSFYEKKVIGEDADTEVEVL
ncbi:MAG: PolC-type DNA polymerase III, partial [Lachnospiraceae bacterium]|nr:PolC-type DNA polymerase III [Lachnospiraceae bacterium]